MWSFAGPVFFQRTLAVRGESERQSENMRLGWEFCSRPPKPQDGSPQRNGGCQKTQGRRFRHKQKGLSPIPGTSHRRPHLTRRKNTERLSEWACHENRGPTGQQQVKSSQGLLFSEARKPCAEAAGHARAQGLVSAGVVPTTPRSLERVRREMSHLLVVLCRPGNFCSVSL